MKKSKKYTQCRTLDFSITNIVSVDLDALGIKLQTMPEDFIKDRIEKAWSHYVTGCDKENCDLCEFGMHIFSVAGVMSKVIPDSLRTKSIEALDEKDDF